MAEPQSTEASTNPNAAAEKDAQDFLAQLKSEETTEPVKQEEDAPAPAQTDKPDSADNAKQDEAEDEAAEEAKIIAAANRLGQESAPEEKSNQGKGDRRDQQNKKRVNYSDNIKSDVTTLEQTNDPEQIRKQVEFYFSDSNLPMDKFLLQKVGGSENKPVEISVLHSFKRMRRFQPFEAIVEALKDSEALELTDDNTCVRRKVPLADSIKAETDRSSLKVYEDKAMHRSIYAKGFGEEEPSTQFDIEAFFAPYGPTNAVRLRRTDKKMFKGSVFVEFDSEETQKKFLDLDPKPKWKGTTELLIKSKKEYCEDKIDEIKSGRVKPSGGRGNFRGRGRGRGGRGFGRGRGRGHNHGNRDRNSGRQDAQKDARGVPVVQTSQSESGTGTKRARDDADDNGNSERPAKKVVSDE